MLERRLAARPAPPVARALPGVGQVRGRKRAALGHLGIGLRHIGAAPRAHVLAGPLGVLVHAIAQQRIERHRHEARGVAPVFEELAALVRELIERRDRIRPEPRKRRDVVRAGEDVDRIDLERVHALREATQVCDARPRRPRTEALRRDRQPASLRERECAAIQNRAARRRRTSCSPVARRGARAGPRAW